MSEIYSFYEAELKRVGTASGDTTETAIDAYAEGISVEVSREVQERIDTSGVVFDRVPIQTRVTMSISKLYCKDADSFLFDGNDMKLYFNDGIGSETWQMDKCWWLSKGWSLSSDSLCTYDIEISGNSWGTV